MEVMRTWAVSVDDRYIAYLKRSKTSTFEAKLVILKDHHVLQEHDIRIQVLGPFGPSYQDIAAWMKLVEKAVEEDKNK